MNLEKMRIGFKPSGFPTEKRNRNYWNSLDLELSNHHTTATVTHWTGRKVNLCACNPSNLLAFGIMVPHFAPSNT